MAHPFWHASGSLRASTAIILSLLIAATFFFFRQQLHTAWRLVAFEIIWARDRSSFTLPGPDNSFDVTLDAYPLDAQRAAPFDDVVPARIHHVSLGGRPIPEAWSMGRQSCLDRHPEWEVFMWTDENAEGFVREKFPHLLDLWKGYKYPVERVDALRYMVLYEYGGAVLDMDLECIRGLGPLRRFQFVAPEAYPQGFSVGFMMAAQHNAFVGELVNKLRAYDRQWFALPYPTVMFSTGCHYASTIHAYQANRTELKILPGPLHSLNGAVVTPLFRHLGSSSWHDYDARIFSLAPIYGRQAAGIVVVGLFVWQYVRRRRKLDWRAWEKVPQSTR